MDQSPRPTSTTPAATTEELEPRMLLSSATRVGDSLIVRGDKNAANVIVVGYATPAADEIRVSINGVVTLIDADDLGRVRINGGSKNDRITIDSSQARFDHKTTLSGGAGDDRFKCGDEFDYVVGGDGDDRLMLGAGRNFAFGEAGNDTIGGGDQRDYISGGAGDDLIHGGELRDQILGDGGDDVIFGGTGDADTPDGSDLIFGGKGNDTISGEGGKNVIFGESGDDVIFGGNDRDEIFAMAGNDLVDGKEEDDTIYGGAGDDTLKGGGGGGEVHDGEYKYIQKLVDVLRPRLTDAD